MTATVKIRKAVWRGFKFKNTECPIVTPFKLSPDRNDGLGTITVDCSKVAGFPQITGCDNMRVRVRTYEKDIEQFGVEDTIVNDNIGFSSELNYNDSIPLDGDYNGETEEQAIMRINERFSVLDEITEATAYGHVRSAIISGPPGVGKSFGVEKVLQEINGLEIISNSDIKYEVISGSASPIGVYKKLFEHSDKDHVVVFDDCDSVLLDPVSLAILKAALDTSKRRYISWNSESYSLVKEGIPNKFEFKGAVLFLTNIDFSNVRSKVLKPHLEAIQSRCLYLHLGIETMRDKFLRVKGLTKSSGMLDEYDFAPGTDKMILNYIKHNIHRLRELSLRTVLKIANLVRYKKGKDWERLADLTILK